MSKFYQISNCRLSYECSKSWNDLADLPGEECIKYCRDCRNTVHRCDNETDLDRLVSEGRCIAFFESELIQTTGEWISLPNPEDTEKEFLLIKIARLAKNELSILFLINDNPGITSIQISNLSGIPLTDVEKIVLSSLNGLCTQEDKISWFVTSKTGHLIDQYNYIL